MRGNLDKFSKQQLQVQGVALFGALGIELSAEQVETIAKAESKRNKKLAYNRKWKMMHHAECVIWHRKYNRAWRARNRERINAKKRQFYSAHREEQLARTMAWRKANPEKVKAIERRYRETHREKINARMRARRAKEKAERLAVMLRGQTT